MVLRVLRKLAVIERTHSRILADRDVEPGLDQCRVTRDRHATHREAVRACKGHRHGRIDIVEGMPPPQSAAQGHLVHALQREVGRCPKSQCREADIGVLARSVQTRNPALLGETPGVQIDVSQTRIWLERDAFDVHPVAEFAEDLRGPGIVIPPQISADGGHSDVPLRLDVIPAVARTGPQAERAPLVAAIDTQMIVVVGPKDVL